MLMCRTPSVDEHGCAEDAWQGQARLSPTSVPISVPVDQRREAHARRLLRHRPQPGLHGRVTGVGAGGDEDGMAAGLAEPAGAVVLAMVVAPAAASRRCSS